jgi:hypothetical protein
MRVLNPINPKNPYKTDIPASPALILFLGLRGIMKTMERYLRRGRRGGKLREIARAG